MMCISENEKHNKNTGKFYFFPFHEEKIILTISEKETIVYLTKFLILFLISRIISIVPNKPNHLKTCPVRFVQRRI